MLYIIIILIMMSLITTFNIIFNPIYPFYVYIIACVAFTISVIIVDAIVATIIRHMDEKHFDYHKKIFNASKKKLAFYKAIGVKKWKDKVPELGMFTNFRKNKVENPKDPEYLKRYILEACYGVIIHYVSVPFSFLIMLLDFKMYTGESNLYLTIALPVALVNVVLIVLPAFILRYNLPKLIRLYEYSLKKQ
ncbi:MAG: hypothetical protein J6W64_01185 [Bacilli bacterium]|nr:hypothetical protein [Bacilli bacterium]